MRGRTRSRRRPGLDGAPCAPLSQVSRSHDSIPFDALLQEPEQETAAPLSAEEGQQVVVDLILECVGQTVRCTGVVDLLHVLDEASRFTGGVVDGDDLVVLTVQEECRNVDLLEVLGEVGLRERLDALVGVLEADLHTPQPELIQGALGDLAARSVGTVELDRQIPVELDRSLTSWERRSSKTSRGSPSGLADVLIMIGGTAAISTALATRSLP